MKLTMSTLPKTWLIDVDGTILEHNGHLNGQENLLPGVQAFFDSIPATDTVILLTAREGKYLQTTSEFLKFNGIRFDKIITGMPVGERILINDCKPSGLEMAHAVNVQRDKGLDLDITLDPSK